MAGIDDESGMGDSVCVRVELNGTVKYYDVKALVST